MTAERSDKRPDKVLLYRGQLWLALVAYGNFLFRYRNVIFPLVMAMTFIGFRPNLAGGSLAADRWLDLVGLLIVIAGQAVRAAVIGLAYIRRGGLNKKVYAEALVTNGIFAHSRNPIYVGNLLMIAGYLVIHNSLWVYLLGSLFFLISYRAIVAAEEQFLHSKFGSAYVAYCRATPRWAIDLGGLGRTFTQMSFNWRWVLAKDYTTCTTWIMTVLGLYGYEVFLAEGLERGGSTLVVVAILARAILLAALVIRALKKPKRLTYKVSDKAGMIVKVP